MSNSPPSKVSFIDTDSANVLCSGIDTLVLTLDIYWKSDDFFNQLFQLKSLATIISKPSLIKLKTMNENTYIYFDVMPYGAKGYEWLLINREYSLTIGDWTEPCSRPSVLIEIRSETLHKYGTIGAVEIILSYLINIQAKIKIIRVTRVDLYSDILLPEECWSEDLKKYLVTRANKRSWHNEGKIFSGFSIGKGSIMARLYDKPLEILQQSGKNWMYDIWKINKVPSGFRIIRVEFQLRREKIKRLGINTFDDLIRLSPNLWAYCTKRWLKLQDKPETHHTQRHTFNFWKTVQSAYHGAKDAISLIAIKVASKDREQLLRQLIGNLTSIEAIDSKGKIPSSEKIKALNYWVTRRFPESEKYGASQENLEVKIKNKMVKHYPSSGVYTSLTSERKISNSALENYQKEHLEIERKEFNRKKLWE